VGRQLLVYLNEAIPNGLGENRRADTGDMLNGSSVPGVTLSDALNNLVVASGAVVSVFGRVGAVVAVTGDYTTDQVTNGSTVPGASCTAALDSLQTQVTAALAKTISAGAGLTGGGALSTNPTLTLSAENQARLAFAFAKTYHVDPAFGGTPDGAINAPYTSIGAAITAAVAAGLTACRFVIPPNTVFTENVTMPSIAGSWELCCEGGSGGIPVTPVGLITGNITCTTAAGQAGFKLTNLSVTGNVSGNAVSGAGNFLYHQGCKISGTVSLTGSGGGFWFHLIQGFGDTQSAFSGNQGATTVFGGIAADKTDFTGAIDTAASSVQLANCRLPTAITCGGLDLLACLFVSSSTITGSGSTITVKMDGSTYATALDRGLTLVSAVIKTQNANMSVTRTFANNIGASTLNGGATTIKSPPGMYRMSAVLDLLAAGTAGTAQVNAIYVDTQGVTQTLAIPLATLLITAAVGTEGRGEVLFYHNGSNGIQYSVTGVVTPGALSAQLVVAAKRVD